MRAKRKKAFKQRKNRLVYSFTIKAKRTIIRYVISFQKGVKHMIKEFKEFIMRGNVIELAVGIVMGAAFTAIVTALVDNIITPIIAAVSGKAAIGELTVKLGSAQLGVGNFLQAIIDFFIIALVVFLMIKFINKLSRKKVEDEEVEVEAPAVEDYLAEIRDILAQQKATTSTTTDDLSNNPKL